MENQSVNLVMVDVDESIAYANSCDNVSLRFGPADIETTFVVSSATLCLPQYVWRAVVSSGGQSLEAYLKERRVSPPNDDHKYLLLFLNTVHPRFKKVPRALPTNEELRMVVLSHIRIFRSVRH